MASRPKSICRHAACGTTIAAPGYCEKHAKDKTGWYATSTKSAQERGYGWAWKKKRESIMRRDCGLCQVCRKQGRIKAATEVDHIIGKAQGGTDDDVNLQAICAPCHASKTGSERQR